MGYLTVEHFSGSLYFRGYTSKLPEETIQKIVSEYEISLVVDLTKHPDTRYTSYTKFIAFHVPESKNASIFEMEKIAATIRKEMNHGNVMVISYFGRNRAPAICALASEVPEQELRRISSRKKLFSMPYFRSLVGL